MTRHITQAILIGSSFAVVSLGAFAQTRDDRSGGGAAEFSNTSACDEAGMALAENEMIKMDVGARRANAGLEISKAREMMLKNDLAGCRGHMEQAWRYLR